MSDSFGVLFRITSFGESHGKCVGVVVDGCPAGLSLTQEDVQKEVDKRRPASNTGQTARVEEDKAEILSGVFNGHTTGAPIAMLVWNRDTDSSAYERMRFTPRPGHADYTAYMKYGSFNDYRGGGRFSGRITAGMVMAGAVAKKLLEKINVEVMAHVIQIGMIKTGDVSLEDIRNRVYQNPLRCADDTAAKEMTEMIQRVAKEGDSVGGTIQALALNVPAGLGEPWFDTLEGELAKALFSIPAVKGVDFGAGFSSAKNKGSENNDALVVRAGKVITETNNAGGILGGISSGMPLTMRVAIKPTPSISKQQKTIDLNTQENVTLDIKGRHDVCIVPRAVVVVESMIAVTLCDLALRAGLMPRVIK